VKIAIGQEVVAVDPRYYRPTEVDLLIGDPNKSKTQLGWKPKYDLPMLVQEMVQSDLDLFKREKLLHESGFRIKNQYE
jgi:GDPmannose 4,6-dehydratase